MTAAWLAPLPAHYFEAVWATVGRHCKGQRGGARLAQGSRWSLLYASALNSATDSACASPARLACSPNRRGSPHGNNRHGSKFRQRQRPAAHLLLLKEAAESAVAAYRLRRPHPRAHQRLPEWRL